jgi:hypothetical protein
MGKLNRVEVLNDKGDRISGTPINNQLFQALQDAIDTEVASGNNPTISVRSLVDNFVAGMPFDFGGTDQVGTADMTYPVGSTPFNASNGAQIFAPNTRIFRADSALLSEGTYGIEAMLGGMYFEPLPGGAAPTAPQATLGIFNITDAPEVALVEVTATSFAGALVRSGAITFPAPGTVKDYAVKLKWVSGTSGVAVRAWGIRLVRLT